MREKMTWNQPVINFLDEFCLPEQELYASSREKFVFFWRMIQPSNQWPQLQYRLVKPL
uniref:Uncharacterized protein n=1 Tax=Solanum tuberosum TaxID=4113 RepID=M1B5S7_SOLTU